MKYADINTDKVEYVKRFKKYILPRTGARGGNRLLAYMLTKTDFFTAPASKRNHMATVGGLCRHSLNVDDALCELMLTPGSLWNQYAIDHNITRETIAVVALLHDICKVNFYVDGFKNQKTYDPDKVAAADKWKRKKDGQGEFIWETVPSYDIDDKFPIGHGEKSLFMISQYIDLSRDEIMAIRWHMGFTIPQQEWGTLNNAMDCSPFIIAMHMADLTATHLMEVEENGYEAKGIVSEAPVAQTPSSEDVHDDISMEANMQAEPVQNGPQEELIPEENLEALEQEFHIDETAAAASQEDVPAVKENEEEFVISDKDLSDFADMLSSM